MDLILHIGLPKTGTTTIQWHIRHCPCYSSYYSTKLKNICRTFQGDQERRERKIKGWLQSLYQGCQRIDVSCDSILLSSEAMFVTNPATYRMKWPVFVRELPQDTVSALRKPVFSDYLHSIKNNWPYGQVKVLLTLRNQPDWLASLYAQLSNRIKKASQIDFENEIQDLIQRKEDYVDWSSWVDNAQQVVGKNNLKVLLLEDIHLLSYWNEFCDFTGLGNCIDSVQIATIQSQHRNARQVNSNTWGLRQLRHISPNLNEAYIALRKDKHHSRFLYLKGFLNQYYRELVDLLFRQIRSQPKKPGIEIHLHSELRAQIRHFCQPYNARLAKQLNRDDIYELGY